MQTSPAHQKTLLNLAKRSIESGLEHGQPLEADVTDAELQKLRATFVTLNRDESLRGCIGTLEASRSLAEDVAHNAFSAAFRDPRFEPLRNEERETLHLHISVLTPPQPMKGIVSMQALIERLEPHRDGLIISEGYKRATFLPSVWEQVESTEAFVAHLMRKAGIHRWTEQIRCERYGSDSFGAHWAEI